MNKEKIEQLGSEWKALDEKYDNLVQSLIDTPEPLTSEKMEMLKKMQEGLFNLEVELFKVLQEN